MEQNKAWNLERVGEITDSASRKLLQLWPGKKGGQNALKISLKADGSFVTDADYASNDILVKGLKAAFPNDAILSEETTFDERLLKNDRLWLIDPLDGTASFIDGDNDFAILIACLVQREVHFAYLRFPALGLIAFACKGGGASADGKQLRVSDFEHLKTGRILCRNFTPRSKTFITKTEIDSGLMFLKVCSGELDAAVLKIKKHREWDIAPLIAMVQESGGTISDEHGDPITFFQGPQRGKYVVASNGKVHDKVLSEIASNI